MRKIGSVIDTIIKYFLVILVAVISVLGFYQVIVRYALNNPSTWSEEAIRFLFVWASCVGAGIGIKEHVHIGIDVLVNLLPDGLKKVAQILVYAILIFFGAVMLRYGIMLTTMTGAQMSPALKVRMGYVYGAVPVMGVLVIYYSVIAIIGILLPKNTEKEEEAEC